MQSVTVYLQIRGMAGVEAFQARRSVQPPVGETDAAASAWPHFPPRWWNTTKLRSILKVSEGLSWLDWFSLMLILFAGLKTIM